MTKLIDLIWLIFLAPIVYLGSIANKYKDLPHAYKDTDLFPYFDFELPNDKECNDISNKRKWLHRYRKTKWGSK